MEIGTNYTDQMNDHLKRWSNSGQTRKDYCRSNGISYQKFNYWVKKTTKDQAVGLSCFKEIKPDPSINAVEIHFPSGIVVKLKDVIDLKMLKSLL